MKIPHEELQAIAARYGLSYVIMLAYEPDGNREHVVTWGKSIVESDQAAQFGNKLKDALGWPETLRADSAKVTALIEENKQLKTHIAAMVNETKQQVPTLNGLPVYLDKSITSLDEATRFILVATSDDDIV